jgi:hypothetical protein
MGDEPEEITHASALESYETLERQAKASSKSRKRGAGTLLRTPLYIPSIPPSLLQHAAERSSGMAVESGAVSGAAGGGAGGKEGGLEGEEEEEEGVDDEREARREKRRAQRKRAARAQHAEEVKALGGKAALAAADKRQRGLLAKGTLSAKAVLSTSSQLLAPGMTVEVVGSGNGGGGASSTSGGTSGGGGARKGAAGAATSAATASGAVAFLQARLGAGRRSKV